MATSAVPTLYAVIVQTLMSSTFLAGDKAYDEGNVPSGSPTPYVVIAPFSEGTQGASRFMQRGHRNGVQLRCWGGDRPESIACFDEVKRLFDGVRLTLTGHTAQRAYVDYLTDFAEPDTTVGGHVVQALVRLTTLVA